MFTAKKARREHVITQSDSTTVSERVRRTKYSDSDSCSAAPMKVVACCCPGGPLFSGVGAVAPRFVLNLIIITWLVLQVGKRDGVVAEGGIRTRSAARA